MENNFNNTTNDDLARMIARGFEGVDKEFIEVRKELCEIKNILIENHEKRIKI